MKEMNELGNTPADKNYKPSGISRAEERALEAYPVYMQQLVYQDLIEQFGGKTEIDVNTYPRHQFQEGYEQAEKDMKEQFIQFVHSHYPINYTGWIQDFQRAMEDEK